MQNGSGRSSFPSNEPAEGRKQSQIDEYVEWYADRAFSTFAMSVKDICATVAGLAANGGWISCVCRIRITEDLRVAWGGSTRTSSASGRLGHSGRLRRNDGYLLQIFHPAPAGPADAVSSRSSNGTVRAVLGSENFKALFVSLEREQARRGNLT